MQEVLYQLMREYPTEVSSLPSHADQLFATVALGDVPAVADALRRLHGARLVTIFAEDRLQAESVFHNYYVFERSGDPWLVLRAAIPSNDPRFPSLASTLPAVNWQEREIQD